MADTGWLDRAQDEFVRAQRDYEAEDDEAALQHACQAVECALKSVIVSEGRSLPDDRDDDDYQTLQEHANAHLSAHADIIEELSGIHSRVVSPDAPAHGIEDDEFDRVMDEVEAIVTFADTYVTP